MADQTDDRARLSETGDISASHPTAWFLAGIGLGTLAVGVLWLMQDQVEQARITNARTFEFSQTTFVRFDLLVALAGGVFGMILLLAVRRGAKERTALLSGGSVAPLLIVAMWHLLWQGWLPLSVGRRVTWVWEGSVHSTAIVAATILLTVAVGLLVSRDSPSQ
ncbi:MAG: hypothetical protein BMS9Abin07_1496 [Acidimicrobiia bacterium]|nr:MAG: hypothetical protein BMS9Abin07_1496 [Acidimicrobiia bacterium]